MFSALFRFVCDQNFLLYLHVCEMVCSAVILKVTAVDCDVTFTAAVTMMLWISLQPFHFMSNSGQLVHTHTHASVIKQYPFRYWPKSTGAVRWERNCRPGSKY